MSRHIGTLLLVGAIVLSAARFSFAQDAGPTDSQDSGASSATVDARTSAPDAERQATEPATNAPPPQPKRILGIMPNFRAVSAGTIPPPPTPKQAFVIATRNSFDYSSFIFVGITSAFAEWSRRASAARGRHGRATEDITGADLWIRPMATTG